MKKNIFNFIFSLFFSPAILLETDFFKKEKWRSCQFPRFRTKASILKYEGLDNLRQFDFRCLNRDPFKRQASTISQTSTILSKTSFTESVIKTRRRSNPRISFRKQWIEAQLSIFQILCLATSPATTGDYEKFVCELEVKLVTAQRQISRTLREPLIQMKIIGGGQNTYQEKS